MYLSFIPPTPAVLHLISTPLWPLVFTDDVPRVQNSWNPTQNTQEDVDEDVGAAAALEEDWQGRDPQREEIEQDVGLEHREWSQRMELG